MLGSVSTTPAPVENTNTNNRHVDVIVRCDCGADHFCSITYWRDEDVPVGYFEIVKGARVGEGGFTDRIKSAWNILRRGECNYADLILNEEKAAQLVEALTPLTKAGRAGTESTESQG